MPIQNRFKINQIFITACSFILGLVLTLVAPGLSQTVDAQQSVPGPAPVVSPTAAVAPTTPASPSPTPNPSPPGSMGSMSGMGGMGSMGSMSSSSNPASLVPKSAEDMIKATLTVLAAEPLQDSLEGSLQFEPRGIYQGKGPNFPSQKLQLRVNSLNRQDNRIALEADKPMLVPSLTWSMAEGKASNYPFDKHVARVFFGITPILASEPENPYLLPFAPLVFKFIADVSGFDIAYTPALVPPIKSIDENSNFIVLIDVIVTRSLPVKLFAVLIMIIMWVLAVLVLLVTRRVIQSGKQPDFGTLGWMGILLFALPAIRNSQPAIPPIGTLSDFLSFFWAETSVAIALTILAICWLRRSTAPGRIK
jgi:hypothetical protein